MGVQTFLTAYIKTALWSSTDNSGEPLDKNHDESDLTYKHRQKMEADCFKFYSENHYKWDDDGQAGHDFWLTRNDHGEGFLSRKPSVYGEHAQELYEAAKTFSTVYLYVTDNGEIDCD